MTTTSRSDRITIVDVSRHAGVSVGTVSRVINGTGPVSQKAAAAVRQSIRDLNYRPNSVAQSLRRQQTKVIGCMIPDIVNPVFAELVKGAEDIMRAKGYIIMVANSGAQEEKELEILRLFEDRKVDALLLSVVNERSRQLRQALARAGRAIVSFDRDLPNAAGAIKYDHAGSMVHALNYLFALGHRRIALITGGHAISVTRERIVGYREAFRRVGYRFDENLIRTGSVSEQHGFEQGEALLTAPDPPSAIIAGANQILVGLMRAMRKHGVRMREDVSVIGCDDTPLAELATPAVTVIGRDVGEGGRAAAGLLLDSLSKDGTAASSAGEPPAEILLPCELIERDSCAVLNRADAL